MGRLDGKVVMVTGAASGLGRATVLRLAQEGASVVCTTLEQWRRVMAINADGVFLG